LLVLVPHIRTSLYHIQRLHRLAISQANCLIFKASKVSAFEILPIGMNNML
jgi:hypothetical protein